MPQMTQSKTQQSRKRQQKWLEIQHLRPRQMLKLPQRSRWNPLESASEPLSQRRKPNRKLEKPYPRLANSDRTYSADLTPYKLLLLRQRSYRQNRTME